MYEETEVERILLQILYLKTAKSMDATMSYYFLLFPTGKRSKKIYHTV